jgi:thioester reductase-like protein
MKIFLTVSGLKKHKVVNAFHQTLKLISNEGSMIYFITGITGTLVPVIVEDLMKKDPNPFFYFAIRKDAKGNTVQARFESVVNSLDLDPTFRRKLAERSRLVEIDVEKEKLGIAPTLYSELIENTEKILHGAADVRFGQPYEKMRIPNVVFPRKIYDLFDAIKQYRETCRKSSPALYYISTGYAYGMHQTPIPEDFPEFHPGKPENTYVRTKAETKWFMLDKISRINDPIVIFEPTIIGGSARTGRTRTYNLHYILIMLGYLGKLPFLTAPENTIDIVPVDWVAAVISDIMAKDQYHQGVVRLASGSQAVPVKTLHDAGYDYYITHDPVPGHEIPKIRFVPQWLFYAMITAQKIVYRAMYFCTRRKRFRKMVKGIGLLEGYFPYITRPKVFENSRSREIIARYTDCSAAPAIQDIRDEEGRLVEKGYFEKIMADTLETGWGGLVDFKRLEKQTAGFKSPLLPDKAARTP